MEVEARDLKDIRAAAVVAEPESLLIPIIQLALQLILSPLLVVVQVVLHLVKLHLGVLLVILTSHQLKVVVDLGELLDLHKVTLGEME